MENNTQVDLKKLFLEFTMSTFMEMGVGQDLDWIGREERHPFEGPSMKRWLNIGKEKMFAEYCTTLKTFINGVVQESIERVMEKRANGIVTNEQEAVKSIVELFVEQSDEDADGLRSEDLIEFILTFVIATRDTTALTLSWMFYELGRNPHVVETTRKEMEEKLDVKKDAYLTAKDIRSLTYLEAVTKESLRFHPVAPFTTRQASKDAFVCGDIPVKKGQTVGLSVYPVSRNPMVWGPDAHEFKPERWVDPQTGSIKITKLFTFASGPRICVGMGLAMMELRVVSVNLLRNYHFDVDLSKNDGSYTSGVTLILKYPLLVNVKRVST
ncbi:hypothetical protein Poli38472_004432 [Pythium oligandrum]|uniref:Cytochrome P450 n=1 Tax=Pythium oligandrum TaxID=41045 RepID=A0A8K1CAZ4_PYTOL|nr:hypothetical protein Poli38472_004432 [Pythium oligandrum]|eukprot:TMW59363.1 hypothetical protein Poli38472_004432 [Pythium oligandrum]